MTRDQRTELIDISQLLLDPENPRLAAVQPNNHDAIRAMTKVQGERVVALAQHLLENGPNPANLMIAIPAKGTDDFFYVLDGNRRLTALKLLESPLLGEGILSSKDLQLLKKLSLRFDSFPITAMNCVIFDKRSDADLWIQLIHRGLNKGAGMLSWDGQVGARYDERRKGQKDVSLQLLDLVQKYGSLSEDTQGKIEDGKFPITTLTRVIGTPYVRKKLGIDKDGTNVKLFYPQEEVAKGLSVVIEDLASGKITVSDLKSQEQRIDYINKLKQEELPSESSKLSEPANLSQEEAQVPQHVSQETDKINLPIEQPNVEKTKPTLFPNRSTLIPRSCRISITQVRVNALFKELKKLDIKEHPNAGAVMLRVFIELSTDFFVEKKLGWSSQQVSNSKLSQRLGAIANFMKSNEIMTENELARIQKAINGDGMLAASIKSMNQYVHNRYYSPVASELIVVWDDFQSFIQKTWEMAE